MDSQDRQVSGAAGASDQSQAITAATGRGWHPPAHHVRVCLVASCQSDDDRELMRAIEERLGIKVDERTPDGAISLEGLECIGLCGIHEAVLIDDVPIMGRDAVLRAVEELLR